MKLHEPPEERPELDVLYKRSGVGVQEIGKVLLVLRMSEYGSQVGMLASGPSYPSMTELI